MNTYAVPTLCFVAMGMDETHKECVERTRLSEKYQLRPEPLDHDAHVTAWRIELWNQIEEIAWLKRQEKSSYD